MPGMVASSYSSTATSASTLTLSSVITGDKTRLHGLMPVTPPSMTSSVAVTKDDSSEAR